MLGIDPGLERVGYGVVDRCGSRLEPLDYGLIQTPRIGLADRLLIIHEGVAQLLARHEPQAVAIERLLFSTNKTTAMDVARASGVVLLAAAQRGVPVVELSPPEIKLGVVGHGGAEKRQVQFMVVKLLGLAETPKPDDVADALAVAISALLRGV